jgi:hypothetical protein
MKNKQSKNLLSVMIYGEAEILEKIRSIASLEGVMIRDVINRALQIHIDQYEQQKGTLKLTPRRPKAL